MKIANITKGTVLAGQAVVADTIFKRLKGLLGEKEIVNGQALVIKPCSSIHTFFMRFPIDILFVGKDNKIIAAISSLPAFRASKIYFNAAYVIELPAGLLKATSTSAGDLLEIE
jgi:hypothetical protein